MQCSNPNADPELISDPLIDTYHPADMPPSPEEMKARKQRRERSFLIDTCL